jgi:hypothetical protein
LVKNRILFFGGFGSKEDTSSWSTTILDLQSNWTLIIKASLRENAIKAVQQDTGKKTIASYFVQKSIKK